MTKYAACVRSGFCCKKSPCLYGEAVEGGRACKYLEHDKDLGGVIQYRCGRYDWIIKNVEGWQYYPAFGAGCGSALFNENRQAIIEILGPPEMV